jgi:hypothetical protein
VVPGAGTHFRIGLENSEAAANWSCTRLTSPEGYTVVTHTGLKAGTYTMSINTFEAPATWKSVGQAPYTVTILPAEPLPSTCSAAGDELYASIAGRDCTFKILMKGTLTFGLVVFCALVDLVGVRFCILRLTLPASRAPARPLRQRGVGR